MVVIDESLTAKGFTPQAQVPLVYAGPRTIEQITIHWWGSYGQTHDGVNDFFVNGPGLTSAHFTASAGRANCLVYPWDAAWHAGNATGNRTTIGIECRPEGSDADYRTIAEVIRFCRDTYGPVLPLKPHRYWQSTQCPGTYDLARLDKMAEALKNPMPGVKPQPQLPIAPKPILGEIVQLDNNQENFNVNVPLKAGVKTFLKKGTANWNLATEGLGYYDIDLFLRGTGLEDGETLLVQAFVVTEGGKHYSGFFEDTVDGNTKGAFKGSYSIKTPLLATAKLEIAVTSSTDAVLNGFGAATYAFKK